MSDYETHRANALAELKRRGFEDGKLQILWRTPECFTRTYDMGEVGAAICDALTREGCTAWWGDGTSCVEQMIRLQWDRAVAAESRVAALLAEVATLRAALEPFARFKYHATLSDSHGLDFVNARAPGGDIAVGDLRRARDVLGGGAP